MEMENSTNYLNAPFSVIKGTLGFARHDKFVQNVNVPPVHMTPVTQEISFSLWYAVESSNRSLCLHNRFALKTFVSLTVKKENAVETWEEIPSAVLFVEQVCVTEELSSG